MEKNYIKIKLNLYFHISFKFIIKNFLFVF